MAYFFVGNFPYGGGVLEKRKINKKLYAFIKGEVEEYQNRDIIDESQHAKIMDIYEISGENNFVKMVVTIGAVLIGLGFMSFIASNWTHMSKPAKFSVVMVAFLISMYASYRLEDEYPKISVSMLYLSALIFGAGIFLNGQTFNYGGHFSSAFLLWGIGIIPMAAFFSDRILFVFSHILVIVYLGGRFEFWDMAYPAILLIPAYYYLNRYVENSKIGTFFTNIVLVNFMIYMADRYNVEGVYTVLLIFAAGAAMYYIPIELNKNIFRVEGIIFMGFSGIMLTYKEMWDELSYVSSPNAVAVIFGILLIAWFLWLASRPHVSAVVFICIIIFRYYFDTFYDFMPKSLFFTVGGLVLLGFGYYIENMRKRGEADVK